MRWIGLCALVCALFAGDARAAMMAHYDLAGLALDAVHRGDVVTDDKNARPTRGFDVRMRIEDAVKRGASAQVYVGTARSSATRLPARSALVLPVIFSRKL